MNLHDQAVKIANHKIASNPKVYSAYTDSVLYEMLVEECEAQLNFSTATFQIHTLREMAYEQGVI